MSEPTGAKTYAQNPQSTLTVAEDDAPDGGTVRLSVIFAAVASDDRLAIVSFLHSRAGAPASIHEVAAAIEMDRFATARHLSILRDAGIAEARRSGQRKLHSLAPGSLLAIDDWLVALLPS